MFLSIGAGPGLHNSWASQRCWSMLPLPTTPSTPMTSTVSSRPEPYSPTRPRHRGGANERFSGGEARSRRDACPQHRGRPIRRLLGRSSGSISGRTARAGGLRPIWHASTSGRALVTENIVDFATLASQWATENRTHAIVFSMRRWRPWDLRRSLTTRPKGGMKLRK